MLRLSGDQNGNCAPSVPGSCSSAVESLRRTNSAVPVSVATLNTIVRPSGETVRSRGLETFATGISNRISSVSGGGTCVERAPYYLKSPSAQVSFRCGIRPECRRAAGYRTGGATAMPAAPLRPMEAFRNPDRRTSSMNSFTARSASLLPRATMTACSTPYRSSDSSRNDG